MSLAAAFARAIKLSFLVTKSVSLPKNGVKAHAFYDNDIQLWTAYQFHETNSRIFSEQRAKELLEIEKKYNSNMESRMRYSPSGRMDFSCLTDKDKAALMKKGIRMVNEYQVTKPVFIRGKK